MPKYFYILVILIAAYHNSTAIHFQVVNEEHEALAGVRLEIWESDGDKLLDGGITDSLGIYDSGDITSFPYLVKVSFPSYRTLDTLIKNEGDLVIELTPHSRNVDEITVTGTMLPTTIKDSPVKTEVVNTLAMQDYLPGTTNMMETLKMVNGITEQVGCGVCFTNSISINGLPGPYTAVLLDGAPVFGNLATVYGLNGIPNVAVEKYEIIKGPNSTLYGSEALAGVINIITKSPKESSLSADAVVSTNNELFANFSYNQKVGSSSGLVSANIGRVANMEDSNLDGFNDMLNLERYSGFTKWSIPIDELELSFGANLYHENRRNGVSNYLKDYEPDIRGDENIYGESIITDRKTFFASVQSKDMKYGKLDLSMSFYDQDSYYGSDSYQAEQNMYWLNYIYPVTSKNHTLLLGATSRYSGYNDNTQATQSINGEDRPDNQFIPGIFAQSEWSLNEEMKLLSGLRMDHYDRHGIILSPRMSYKWSPNYNYDFRLNAGTGFRVVNLFTEDHAFVTGQRQVVIEEELFPEESFNIMSGLSYFYDLGIGWGSGSIDFDVFYTHFQNKILPDYSRDGLIVYSNSEGTAMTSGAAFNINHTFDYNITASYGMTFLNSKENIVLDDGTRVQKDIYYAPDYMGVAMVNYLWEWANITIAYTNRITGPMTLPEVYDINPITEQLYDEPRPVSSELFMIQGLQITKRTEHWDIYLGVQNLSDFMQSYSPLAGYNDPNAQPGFSDFFDTAYAYSPIHGREIYLGIRANY